MKQEQNSFSRLWTYLRAYRLEVCLSIFLKILSVVMSVVEPFVLGLAITELTKNLMDMAKGLAGAGLNTSYIAIIMTLYLFRGVLYELGSYYSNYFMTNAVQKTVQDMRNDLSHKINHIPVSYFDRHQFGDLLGRFTSDVETVSNALQQSFTNRQRYLYLALCHQHGLVLKHPTGTSGHLVHSDHLFQCSIYHEKISALL